MLQLTPLEKTMAGQELIGIAKKEGREEGREEGILIGKIQAIQSFLKKPITSKEELILKSIDELKIILQKLSPDNEL